MTKSQQDYKEEFDQQAFSEGWFDGLSYSFRTVFSVIPVAIGHSIDKIFGLKPLFNSDKTGPFATLLGGVPWLIGATIGSITQHIVQLPMRLGQLIDWGLTSLTGYPFSRLMLGQGGNEGVSVWTGHLEIIKHLYTTSTRTPPIAMRGLFAFTLGALPQLMIHGLDRLACWLSISVQYASDSIYDFALPDVNAANQDPSQPSAVEPQLENPPALETNKRKPRFLRSQAAQEKENDHRRIQADSGNDIIFAQQKQLLSLLGVDKESFEQAKNEGEEHLKTVINQKYRRKAVFCHPDKHPEKGNEFTDLTTAKDILLSPERRQAVYNYL